MDSASDDDEDDDEDDEEEEEDELDLDGPEEEGEENPFGSDDEDAEATAAPDLTKLTARQRAAYTDSFAEPLMMLPEGPSLSTLVIETESQVLTGSCRLAYTFQTRRRSAGRKQRRRQDEQRPLDVGRTRARRN